MIPKNTNKKYFAVLQKKEINEFFEMADSYAFWGWIVPPGDREHIDDQMLVNASGKRGNGPLYIPTESQASDFGRNYTHSTLTAIAINGGYNNAFTRGWYRFVVEQGYNSPVLRIFCSQVNESILTEGVTAIHSICKGAASNNPRVVEDMTRTFGYLYSTDSEYKKIQLFIRDVALVRKLRSLPDEDLQSYYSKIESAIGITAKDVPDLIRQYKFISSKLKA